MTGLRTLDPAARKSRTVKMLIQLVLGGLAGGAGMMLAMRGLEQGLGGRPEIDQVVAIGVGLIYSLMALFVGLGTLNPSTGSKLLNVADEDELRDDRGYLTMSALACLLVGLSLVALAVGGANGMIAPAGALAVLVLATVVMAVVWRRMQRTTDEFRRVVGAQASEVGMILILTVFGSWAALSHLAYAPMFTPLAFLAGCYGLILIAAYWVAWRRGMLQHP